MSQTVLGPPVERSAVAHEPNRGDGGGQNLRNRLIWGGAAGLALLLIVVSLYLTWTADHATTDEAYLDGHVYSVNSPMTDTVSQVLVDDRDHVNAGEILAILDAKDSEERLHGAIAALDVTMNRAVSAEAAMRTASKSANAQASQKDRIRQGQFTSARAAVDEAAATLDNVRLEISRSIIKAPMSGWIVRRSVDPGQYIHLGQPLMEIVEDPLWVISNFKEEQLRKIRPGQHVDVETDTFPKHKVYGHVDSVALSYGSECSSRPADKATENVSRMAQKHLVKIVLNQDSVRGYERLLFPGMSLVVTVATR